MPVERNRFLKSRVMLVEGPDAERFWFYGCEKFTKEDIHVMSFGGIRDLTKFLKLAPSLPNYDQVETLVIARDAEADAMAAMQSIQSSLQSANLPVPAKPFEFVESKPRIAFMLFPGLAADGSLLLGTLEDLCLMTVADHSNLACVKQYLTCLESQGEICLRPHKTKLHAFLCGWDKFVGMKIGEAANFGAWDWNHSAFEPYKRIIASM